jgi:predicted extracellular nuclease
MNTLHPRFLLLCGVVLAAGCLTPKTTGSDTASGDGGSTGGNASVYDIQTGAVEDGTAVTLTGVIATTGMTLDGEGFFVQDAGGGEYSGIYVFLQGTFTDLNFSIGDELTVAGEVTEFYDYTELTVTAETGITVTGTGTATTTPVSGSVSDWEPYEGVLIDLADQTALDCVDTYGETALSAGIDLSDDLYDYDTERGATYTGLIGVISYSFKEFKLNPRSSDDLVGYSAGEGCVSTIAAVRESGQTDGAVELVSVVATSGWDRSNEGFFVQDEGGGMNSGIYVFLGDRNDGSLELEPGDVLDIEGSIDDYYEMLELVVGDISSVSKTGTSTAVATELTAAPSDWEPYEGGLLTLIDANTTSEQSEYGVCDLDYGIVMDDWTYLYEAGNGTHFDALTGNLLYSYDVWTLAPRSEEDLGGAVGGETEATIAQIQDGTVAEYTNVRLTGVVVTSGMTLDDEGFYVQDEGGGMYSGIYVFTDGAVAVAVGDVVDITGKVSEFYDLTELTSSVAEVTITGKSNPVATTLSASPSDWEPYEGVLVTLEGLELTSDSDKYGSCTTNWGDLMVDDDLYDFDDSYGDGDTFESATGQLTWSYDAWRLLPRSDGDLGG